MLRTGKATKVTVYLSDGAKQRGIPVYAGVLDFLFREGVAGDSVFKGVAGFGSGHRLHTAHILELSDHLPIKIEFIDNADKVESILPELQQRCCGGLIEMQETSIIVTTSEEYSTSRPRTIFQT